MPSTSLDHGDSQQCEKADLESREKESASSLKDSNLTLNLNKVNSSPIRNQQENQNIQNNINVTTISTPCFMDYKKCEYYLNCVKFLKSLLLPG